MDPPMTSPYRSAGSAEDEAGGDTDEGERLGERDTDVHLGGQAALELGLTRDPLDGLADDDADADTRADRGQAVPDGRDVAVECGENGGGVHCWFLSKGRRWCAGRYVVRLEAGSLGRSVLLGEGQLQGH